VLFDLLDHKEADLRGKGDPPPLEDIEKVQRFREVVEREQQNPYRLSDLAVDGDDLIAAGFKPGPALGQTLRDLLADVVSHPDHNTRDYLLRKAGELR
jgi:tRNA nucleotidyltransferase (CCA-adding enzyme)